MYVAIQIRESVERLSADIKALNTGLSFPPVNTVLLDDHEAAEVNTADQIGPKVTINKAVYSQRQKK